MANAIIGRENLLDVTYYPVVLSRGNYISTLPLENLKSPLLAQYAKTSGVALADTQFEVDFSVPREVKLVALPKHSMTSPALYRIRYSDLPLFAEALTVNGAHVISNTSISLTNPSGASITIPAGSFVSFGTSTQAYKAASACTIGAGATVSLTLSSGLLANVSSATAVKCRSGNYASPLRDSGWKDVWSIAYPWGTLPYESPSFYSGTYTEEEQDRKINPIVDIAPELMYCRYILVELDYTLSPDSGVIIHRFYAASGWQPTINISYGLRKGRLSNTQTAGSKGGAAFYDVRPNQRICGFSADNVAFDEAMTNVEELVERLDIHRQLFFVLDPDDGANLHRNAFLCTLQQLDPYTYPYFKRINAPFNVIEVLE